MDPENRNVFIGNLPKTEGSVTVQDLREAFVSAGCKVVDIVEVRQARFFPGIVPGCRGSMVWPYDDSLA